MLFQGLVLSLQNYQLLSFPTRMACLVPQLYSIAGIHIKASSPFVFPWFPNIKIRKPNTSWKVIF